MRNILQLRACAAACRYGLAGPNGKGKSTLLRLLAKRQIPVPEAIDVMLVEQEVTADDRTALEAVVQVRTPCIVVHRSNKMM